MLTFLIILHVVLATVVSGHALITKRDPRGAALWVYVLFSLPFAGLLIYWMLGINRVARAASRRHHNLLPFQLKPGMPRIPPGLGPLKAASDSLANFPLSGGNRISLLKNGDQAYPAMLAAIAGSRRTLCLSSFIFDQDSTGAAFTEALCQAAQRGVKVRVLVDGIGAWGPGRRLLGAVYASGGRVASFWPRGRFLRQSGLNLRNHRKILVADGSLGFTGGMNISQRHLGMGQAPRSRDLHFKVQGPVVAQMLAVFLHDWRAATGEAMEGLDWHPHPHPAGREALRGIASAPDQDMEKIYELLLAALRNARHQVVLMSPYFLPDRPMLTALRSARRSGVAVRVLLPRHSDHAFMGWASRGYLWELVEAGVEVREMLGTFIHSKLTVVDSSWCLVGSSNLDPRSWRLNYEFNLEAYSPALARQLEAYIEPLLEHSYIVTLASLRREPLLTRLRNQAAKLFSPYL
jgi:cardiolipin synthase